MISVSVGELLAALYYRRKAEFSWITRRNVIAEQSTMDISVCYGVTDYMTRSPRQPAIRSFTVSPVAARPTALKTYATRQR